MKLCSNCCWPSMDLASRLQAPPKNLRFLPADCLTQFVASQGEDPVLPKPGLCLAALPGGHETLAHGSHGTWHTAHGSTWQHMAAQHALLRFCAFVVCSCGNAVGMSMCLYVCGYVAIECHRRSFFLVVLSVWRETPRS